MSFKTVLVLSIILGVMACKTNQKNLENVESVSESTTICPEDGNCTFEIFNNSSLEIKKDGIDALYPEVKEGDHKVLKFEYKRTQDSRIADDGYREVIYLEISSNTKNLHLEDQDLKQAKVFFGRLCFCGDQAGYFPVEKGRLKVSTNKDKTVSYSLDFEISKVPQKIKSFSITK